MEKVCTPICETSGATLTIKHILKEYCKNAWRNCITGVYYIGIPSTLEPEPKLQPE